MGTSDLRPALNEGKPTGSKEVQGCGGVATPVFLLAGSPNVFQCLFIEASSQITKVRAELVELDYKTAAVNPHWGI